MSNWDNIFLSFIPILEFSNTQHAYKYFGETQIRGCSKFTQEVGKGDGAKLLGPPLHQGQ